MNGGLVSSKSKKQAVVALSTAEAEYVALSSAVQEAMWLRSLLKEIGAAQSQPTVIMQDNQSTIAISNNPQFHERTKHIDIRHHYLRDRIEAGDVALQYCPSERMVADIFTKALDKGKFEELRHKLSVQDSSAAAPKQG